MTKDEFNRDFSQALNRLKALEEARIKHNDGYTTIEGLNNNEPINLRISHDDYESKYVAPQWTKFVESIVKGATFKTNISGTYNTATGALDVSETLDKVETNYGS